MKNGTYVANKDLNVKYTFQLGGGLKGRTVKKGEIVTVIGVMNDIDSQSVSTIELLNRIELNAFKACFTPTDININTDLNENEVAVLRALINQMFECAGGEFGNIKDVKRGEFSKHQFAGYISSLKEKGVFEYLDNYSADQYNGQYAVEKYIMNQFVK